MLSRDLSAVNGTNLSMRLACVEDAAYIHNLRTSPKYNTFLSSPAGTLRGQVAWIEAYKAREKQGEEKYYVISNTLKEVLCGVVRLYDIENDQFTWGSWILDHNKPKRAALESAFLIYEVAFIGLGLKRAVFDVRRENERTIMFHKRFGAEYTHQDELNYYFQYTRERFLEDHQGYRDIIEGRGAK